MYHAASLAKIVLYDPEHDLWRREASYWPKNATKPATVKARAKGGSTKADANRLVIHREAESTGIGWEKLKWAFGLVCNYRGVGWS
jgi:hypothetical protein